MSINRTTFSSSPTAAAAPAASPPGMSDRTHAPRRGRRRSPRPRQPRQAPGASPSGRSGHLGVIVAGSIGTGLLAAVLLDLVVFAGAGEHVITGAAMLAFALGWAMLAVLSARRTDQPQRWAFVPAAAMGMVGAGLLLIAPGNGALTTAGWVWPPVALALAAWMGLQVRRAVKGHSRWLLYPVVALLAAAAVGGMYESAALAHDQRAYAMPGTSYDVGGYRLHLNCTGSGSPTVVLQSGLGETSPMWSRISPAVAHATRVCAYDRAGQGWSGDAPRPQDGVQVADDLHTLLGRAGERGPYVLVGHSTGGAYAMVYAARYPREVAGMVLLDSASADQFTALPDYASFYSIFRRVSALFPSLGRLGVGQVLSSSVGSTLPEPAASQARAFATSPRDLRSQRDELSTYHEVFRQAQALTTLGGKPLVVLTATVGQQTGWAVAQDRLATLSSNSSHRFARSTHAGLLDEQRGSEISVRAIGDVVLSVRTGSPVVTQQVS
jgi:pimeloyl-ACP methyl ester carboxylesterase